MTPQGGRIREVNAKRYLVPTHIVRIQAGWQVRYGTWKSYADKKCGGTGNALAAATAYLHIQYRTHPPASAPNVLLNREVKSRKTIKTGIAGTTLVWKRERPTSQYRTLYAEVWVPMTDSCPTRVVRFYVGSAPRIDRNRVVSALVTMQAGREYIVANHTRNKDALDRLDSKSIKLLPRRPLEKAVLRCVAGVLADVERELASGKPTFRTLATIHP